MALGVLSYPVLREQDYNFIQEFRRKHDPLLYSVIQPHVTFVFPVNKISKDDFIREIRSQSEGSGSFGFIIRCAVVNKDAFLDYSHALLVPDEGFSRIIKLHDRLYSGILSEERRLDIDYIPHMGIGTSKNVQVCKKMADQLNASKLEIAGFVKELTIVNFENNNIENLCTIPLGKDFTG